MRAVAACIGVFAVALLGAVPAAAAPGTTKPEPHQRVDTVTVSNPAPTRDSAIDVFSAGWRPRGVVAITLGDTELRRVRADATGAVRAEVTIPAGIRPGNDSLSVSGVSATGVPQAIVTGLSVVADQRTGSPRKPWLAISVVLALAALLLLASQRVDSQKTRLAA